MKSAHLQNVEMEASAVQVDKLTHIRGIGPAFERYLNQVGIFTYAQLATYSPTDLAELLHGYAGISAQQVAKQDWIGHARALATRSLQSTHKEEERLIEPPSEGQAAPEAPAEAMETVLRQRSAIFTVQLELRPDGSVRRTQVKHARTENGDEEAEQWTGWDAVRLVSFIEQRAGIQGLQDSAGTVHLADMPIEPEQEVIVAEFSGKLKLREIEVLPVGDERSHLILSHGQPFHVRLALDLTDVVIPEGQPISYSAAVLAKRMGSGTREKLGEMRGELARTDALTLDIPASELPVGLYRLEALVDLGVVAETAAPQHTLKEQLKGGLVQIY